MHYQRELSQRAKEGFSISFNDLWAVALEYILHGKVCTLEEHFPLAVILLGRTDYGQSQGLVSHWVFLVKAHLFL